MGGVGVISYHKISFQPVKLEKFVITFLFLIFLAIVLSFSVNDTSAAPSDKIYFNGSSENDNNNGFTWKTANKTIKNAKNTVNPNGQFNIADAINNKSGDYGGAIVKSADPPSTTTKLIFIHHSCGGNWLSNGNGNLGNTLNSNKYYVSESDYGWDAQPDDNLGDHTNTIDWSLWFNDNKMPYVYNSNYNSAYTNIIANPGGENEIIMFKSCYPLSEVGESIDDEKEVYNSLLAYFAAHQNKLFVLITPPGETEVSSYLLTRELGNWLVDTDNGWLKGYAGKNVFVFDFYCVLSEINSHHRWAGDHVEHVYAVDYDGISPYHNGDDHPNTDGNQKATTEFVSLLNVVYNQWKNNGISPTASANIPTGHYNTDQMVTLGMSEAGSIYYTINGQQPTTESTLYTGPILINTTTILKFIAVNLVGNQSQAYTQTYTIDKVAPTASANPTGRLYNTNKLVTLKMSEAGSIYYLVNGGAYNLYHNPITLTTTSILKFYARDTAKNTSQIYTQTYTIDKVAPTASANPTGRLYNTNKLVTLKMSEAGSIYYTLNGATPTTSSPRYIKVLTLSSSKVLKFLAVDNAGNNSRVYTQIYTIDKIAPKVKSTIPRHRKTGYSQTASIIVKFTENIMASTTYKNITVKNLATNKYTKITNKSLKKYILTLKTKKRDNTWYTVTIPLAAVRDTAGNKLAATYTFKFKGA
jgi:hypothetical protein